MANRRDPQIERKLRPLYDALDNLNNKQAIQRADKILKKEKDFHTAKVLKALALIRLMKCHEAEVLLDHVKAQFPLDECTLQAMSVCYKELLTPECIPGLYERALKYTPNSEDYMTQLFMAYVRIKDYKNQQQIATKLHKMTATVAYSYWNAMSLILMGRDNPDLGKVMCFPLALKIIEKSTEKCEEIPEEVFRLYLEVLEALAMYDKALEELDNTAKNVVIDDRERIRLKLHFYSLLGNTEQKNIIYKNAIINEPNSYDFYRGYFDTVFELLTDTTTPHDPEFQVDTSTADHSVRELTALMVKVSENCGTLPGPELAKADLVMRLRERQIAMCPFASPLLLVLQYVQKFGHKSSCYGDLTIIIDRLLVGDKKELIEILDQYRATVKESNGTKAMQRLATLHLLLRHLGQFDDLDNECNQKFIALQEIWNFHQITMEDDLGCTYIDTFTLLYAWEKADRKTNPDVVEAIKCVTSKLEQCPEASACRLLATKLFGRLGAIGAAVEMFAGLDTKSMQLDSLAHILYPMLVPLGAYNRADKQARQMESFYRTSEREVVEYVVKSYLCGKFHKILELFELHKSLQYSISRSICMLDKLWLSVILATSNTWDNVETVISGVREELPSIKTRDLIDNRDFTVNEICDKRHTEYAAHQATVSYQHDSLYVLLRHFMLSSLVELHQYIGSKDRGAMEQLITRFTTDVVEKLPDLVVTQDSPDYLLMSESMGTWRYFVPLVNTVVTQSYKLLQFVVHNHQDANFKIEEVSAKFMECIDECQKRLLIDDCLDSRNLAYLSALVQMINFAILCLSCGISSKIPRKKKVLADSVLTALKTMYSHTLELCNACINVAVQFKLQNLTLIKDDSIDSRIGSSVEWSLDQMKGVLTKLPPLLNSLQNRHQPK